VLDGNTDNEEHVTKRKKAREPGGKNRHPSRPPRLKAVVDDAHYMCQECGAQFVSRAGPVSCPNDETHLYLQWLNFAEWDAKHPMLYDERCVTLGRRGL